MLRVAFKFSKAIWENVKMGEETSEQIKTNEAPKKVDLYCCTIKTLISGKLKTVGNIPREVSRHAFFFIGEERKRVDGYVLSTRYSPSSIPSGGLERPLMLTFRRLRCNPHQKIQDFITETYLKINQYKKSGKVRMQGYF